MTGRTVLYGAAGADGRKLAWPLLERAAALCWGWESLPPVERTPRGKPYFPGLPDRRFSLSHSGELALCALSAGPVGVDIEVVRPRPRLRPERLLSGEELMGFDGSWADFYCVWTLKESWCKREDAPLWPPQRVRTPPPCPHRSYAGQLWRAAVCCTGEPPEDIIWLDIEKEGIP